MRQRDWLWDRRVPTQEAARILKDPNHQRFTDLAALLLARKNVPREVFKEWLSPLDFCHHWPRIKRQMRTDQWNNPRIVFWQAIYERLKEKYRESGEISPLRPSAPAPADELCQTVGEQIKNLRKEAGLTQQTLAKRLKVSQQMISRIESGRENVSLLTLKQVSNALGRNVKVEIGLG